MKHDRFGGGSSSSCSSSGSTYSVGSLVYLQMTLHMGPYCQSSPPAASAASFAARAGRFCKDRDFVCDILLFLFSKITHSIISSLYCEKESCNIFRNKIEIDNN